MTHTVPFLDRRRLLGLLASLPVLGRAGKAAAGMAAMAAPAFPDTATILVAGPDGGDLDQWSRLIQPALARGLPPDTALRRLTTGAPDGVTGANQFDARSEPDGQTVLLAPGEVALARLVGDPRAQYEVARWMSVMTVLTPGIVVTRPGPLSANRRLRFATPCVAGSDLPAVLGLELLGSRIDPLPAMAEGSEPGALRDGAVDAVFLRGHKVPQQVAALTAMGGRPLFSLGALDGTGALARCSAFPDVPTLPELLTATRAPEPSRAIAVAWRAAATAARIECTLVLPELTPAAMVALWRSAGSEAAATLDVQAVALSLGVRAVAGPEATASAGAAVANQAAVLELRRWLIDRFDWRPA